MSLYETDEADGVLDLFKVYLKDVGTLAMLSAEREKELGYVLIEGRKAPGIPGAKVVEAEQELVVSHLPLVISKAKSYQGRLPQVDIKDLVQAGNIGLLEAARRFDPKKGARFSTYASSWIWKFMVEEYQKTRWIIRMPDRVMRLISWKNKVVDTLFQTNGTEPTFEELTLAIAQEKAITFVEAERLVQTIDALKENVVSLDSEIGEEQDVRLVDLIVDRSVPAVDDSLEDLLRSDDLRECLSSLTERERSALEHRFGFSFGSGDGRSHTLEEVGKEWGVTSERIRQIEAKALRKLRHPTRARRLKDHLD